MGLVMTSSVKRAVSLTQCLSSLVRGDESQPLHPPPPKKKNNNNTNLRDSRICLHETKHRDLVTPPSKSLSLLVFSELKRTFSESEEQHEQEAVMKLLGNGAD